jgi:hypothetical protein
MPDPAVALVEAGLGEAWDVAMRQGRFADAWIVSDRVLAGRSPNDADKPFTPPHLRFVWRGEAIGSKIVLLRCYHGLGDTIQFIRFAGRLKALHCGVLVQAQPALLPLLARMRAIDMLTPLDWTTPDPPYEVAIEIMELGHALRLGPRDLPGYHPYLTAPPDLVAARAAAMPPDGRLRIGIAWTAGDWDALRSLPLAALQPLAGLPAITFYSLQRGGPEAELNHGVGPAVANPEDRSCDILDTAALIANLDLVITVDTMVAHLAGAMGRRVWLLLRHHADWRWMEGRDDSPWYPGMRLFRQPAPGDWDTPVRRVAELLRATSVEPVPTVRPDRRAVRSVQGSIPRLRPARHG